MNNTFFIRILDNGNILVKNNTTHETKIVPDTEAMLELVNKHIENMEKENESNDKRHNVAIKDTSKR